MQNSTRSGVLSLIVFISVGLAGSEVAGQGLEADDGSAGGGDVGEENQGAGLVGFLDHGPVGDAGNEAQGALGAHQQVAEDIQRIVEIHQGIE